MFEENHTVITQFIILGFQNLYGFKIPFFICVFSLYVITLSGNFLIVLLVSTCHILRSPMYFFLCHLSLCDALLSTSIVPKMLHVILEDGSTISLSGCLTQLQMFGWCCTAECYILTVMSYDRYIAICNPLHYSSIMEFKFCLNLVICSWVLGFLFALITRILLCRLEFCNRNTIDHFFCDFLPILELSCSDTSFVEMEAFMITPLILLIPFLFVIVTYVYIIFTILRISSTTGRQKAFSTCSSHLAVVCVFYGTLISIYVSPSQGYSVNINKFTSLAYTMVTPLFNPIIYTLRNKDIRKAFGIFLKKTQNRFCHHMSN